MREPRLEEVWSATQRSRLPLCETISSAAGAAVIRTRGGPFWRRITDAATALRRERVADADGLCPDAVLLATSQAPEETFAAILELVSETSSMSLCTIHARAWGSGHRCRPWIK